MTTLIHKRRTTVATLSHKRRSPRQRRSSSRIARVFLLISFIILIGRFAYSSVSALIHHQEQQQRVEQTQSSMSHPHSTVSFIQKE